MSATRARSGRSRMSGLSLTCKLEVAASSESVYECLLTDAYCTFRSREYPTTNRYRDKDRDRKSERGDRYSSGSSRRHYDKHSISRPRWPNESYPSTSSSHYKRMVSLTVHLEVTTCSNHSLHIPICSRKSRHGHQSRIDADIGAELCLTHCQFTR